MSDQNVTLPKEDQFDPVKALRITRQRAAHLLEHCEDENTKLGLDDLYNWLDTLIPLMPDVTDLRASLLREQNARKVLADDNDRLRKDASRYRWLRQQKHAHIAASWVVSDEVKVLASGIPGPACIDTAIDAEMERQS